MKHPLIGSEELKSKTVSRVQYKVKFRRSNIQYRFIVISVFKTSLTSVVSPKPGSY